MSDNEESGSSGRSKRRKVDKFGRGDAFARLKAQKEMGTKNKYMDETPSNIYEVVEESEYSKIVNDRASDWIVDDDGNGYVEDGREIFDDEEDYEDTRNSNNKRRSTSKKKNKKQEPEPVNKKASLKNFFSKTDPKKKEAASVDDDNILSSILGELDDGNSEKTANNEPTPEIKPAKIVKSFKKIHDENEDEVKKYMENFGKNLKRNKNEEKEKEIGDELLKKILNEDHEKKKEKNKENKMRPAPEEIPDPKEEITEIELPEAPKTNGYSSGAPKTNGHSSEASKTNGRLPDPPKTNGHKDELNESIKEDLSSLQETHFDDDFSLDDIQNAGPSVAPKQPKYELQKDEKKPVKITDKPINYESTILNELQGIDFNNEIEMDASSPAADKLDLNKETMTFYYWDAWTDANKCPGEVYLFGKVEVPGKNKSVPEYQSICVHVENVDRCLYLLPRTHIYNVKTKETTDQEVTLADVYNEFSEKIAMELNIPNHRTRKVVKNFAFQIPDVDVPVECEYLEVRYSGKLPAPNLKKEYATIAHIFGTNTSPIETFLLERKIKGPNWMEVKNFKVIETPISWTKVGIRCPDMNCVKISETSSGPVPPLVVCALNVKCVLNEKTTRNEIVMISCLINDNYSMEKANKQLANRQYCGVTKPSTSNWPLGVNQQIQQYKKFKIFKFNSERELLTWFLSIYQTVDPDVVVTHDANDCQLDIICNRLTWYKIPMWSRIGRLKMKQITAKRIDEFFIGRMICDVKLSAQELIKSRSYDLGTLCEQILKIKEDERQEILFDNIPYAYDSCSSIIEFVELNVQDCLYILKLMGELNILPLASQITTIAGNLMSRTLQGGRSERNEFLLLHAFHEKQYIVPDRQLNFKDANLSLTQTQTQATQAQPQEKKKKAAYTGGLVLEPIKGFYHSFVLLMDFNSLYPSIIQEYNICYTTISPTSNPDELPKIPDSSVELGILPRQIRRLVESRRNVKSMMAKPNLSPELKMQYNIRQMALKLTANSMYGCLGFSKSRFYAPHLAALVTFKGRDILMNTKTLAERMNHSVIYGDTDSIMINTNSVDFEEVYKIGTNIKQAVNKVYKHVELEIDGVFKFLLLLKKKKYAAVTAQQKNGKLELNREYKGLDIVRRDWSKIASNTGRFVLDILLTEGKEMDERIEEIYGVLEKLKDDLLTGKVPLPILIITKQLTKAPNEYNDMSSLPHVQVAMRMNIQKNRRFKKGDMIDYIICKDGTNNAPVKRGYHLDEIKGSEILSVDTDYYLSQQIHPVISRLLEPIEGIDAALIAMKLGLDPTKFKSHSKPSDEANEGESLIKTSSQKYRLCEKFMYTCVACKTLNYVAAAFKRENNKMVSVFEKCMNTECTIAPYKYAASINNQLLLTIHKNIQKFYDNWYICDNPLCNNNTQTHAWPTTEHKSLLCLTCKNGSLSRVYTETELNTQLAYYKFMFDLQKYDPKFVRIDTDVKNTYDLLNRTVDKYLTRSAYFLVSFPKIYQQYDVTNENDNQNHKAKKINWSQLTKL